jgi:thiol-disulfide isomerase/thioredoxin
MAMQILIVLLMALLPASHAPDAPHVKVIGVEALENLIHDPSPGIRVINFWATWCKPCIEELPYFEAIGEDPAYGEVEIYLVSLDFISDLENRVIPFVAKRDINSPVLLLDNTDYNSWINKVDASWSGAIPATLMVNGATGEKVFFEQQFQKGELEENLSNFMNQ